MRWDTWGGVGDRRNRTPPRAAVPHELSSNHRQSGMAWDVMAKCFGILVGTQGEGEEEITDRGIARNRRDGTGRTLTTKGTKKDKGDRGSHVIAGIGKAEPCH